MNVQIIPVLVPKTISLKFLIFVTEIIRNYRNYLELFYIYIHQDGPQKRDFFPVWGRSNIM